MSDETTCVVKSSVQTSSAECPVCHETSQIMGDVLTCANEACDSFGKSWTVETPKVDVVLRECVR